jgi:hypothetical protein
MTFATELRKLRESRAYYAAAGAGDLAVEKLREVPDALSRLQQRADAKDIGGAAVAYVAHVGARAVEVFDGLAERGRRVVADNDRTGGPQLRGRTPELDKAAKATVRRAKETATAAGQTVRTAAATAGEAAKDVKEAAKAKAKKTDR